MRIRGKCLNPVRRVCLLVLIVALIGTVFDWALLMPAFRAEAAEDGALTGKTATEIVDMIGMGWNLGNTFDATGGIDMSHETSWGNPKVTRELIHAVKEAGFSVIRIPVTWAQELDKNKNYTIRESFLNRVQEVVDWSLEEGLFVIINVHHESWLNIKDLDKKYRTVGKELEAVWAQIAERFAEYDQHLIFEGMNEPRMAGSAVEWTGNKAGYAAVNYLLQVFAQTVRSNGKGHNSKRCLMIPGYAASCSTNVMSAVSLPTYEGKVVNNLIASVHCYSPYNFCLKDSQKSFGSADAMEVEAIFKSIRSVFSDQGIPVIMGETSATEKNNTDERVKWAQCMGRCSQAYGIPIVIWDNGSDTKAGGESHAYINRKTAEWNYPTVIQGLFDGFASVERGSAVTGGSGNVSGNAIWSNENGLRAEEAWNASYIKMGAKATWFAEGREIGITYTNEGSGEPKIILDSETKQAWWIPVDPTRKETVDDRSVVWYDYATILAAMKTYNVDDPSDLRNFMVIATEVGVKTYEIVVTGNAKVTFMVNGQRYASGSEWPEDPTSDDWVFVGWYLGKTYDTEYTKDTVLSGDAIVYAMIRYKTDEELTPEPTKAPEPTATPEPTKEAEPTATIAPADNTSPAPTATAAPDTTTDDDGPSGLGWKIVAAIGLITVILLGIVVLKISNQGK